MQHLEIFMQLIRVHLKIQVADITNILHSFANIWEHSASQNCPISDLDMRDTCEEGKENHGSKVAQAIKVKFHAVIKDLQLEN